jgi:hypothetical protein
MRDRPVRRWAAALLNLLFLLAWGEPVSTHPCPMHDGAAVVAAVAAAGHVAAGDLDHGGHGAAHLALPTPPPTHDGGAEHSCQCLGECATASAVALPGVVAVQWQAVVRHSAEPPLAEPVAPSAAAPRLLPFANGPPRLA